MGRRLEQITVLGEAHRKPILFPQMDEMDEMDEVARWPGRRITAVNGPMARTPSHSCDLGQDCVRKALGQDLGQDCGQDCGQDLGQDCGQDLGQAPPWDTAAAAEEEEEEEKQTNKQTNKHKPNATTREWDPEAEGQESQGLTD